MSANRELSLQRSIAASAILSLLGWSASGGSSSGPVIMSSGRRSKSGGAKKNRPNSSGKGGMNPLNQSDLRVKPLSLMNVPKVIPRGISSQVVWDVVKIDGTITGSSSGIVETNFNFGLSNHPQSTAWIALFDQWALPFFSVEFDSRTPPGFTTTTPMLYTALDFDSGNNVGSIQAIEDYGSAEATSMEPAARVLRSIRPSTKGAVGASVGSPQAVLNGPVWCDSAYTNIPHYGIRSIVSTTAPVVIGTTVTLWFCFRNTI